MIRVLEIGNTIPPETFLREHFKALLNCDSEIVIIPGLIQTDKIGWIEKPFLEGLKYYGIANYNRFNFYKKIFFKLIYLTTSDAIIEKVSKASVKRIKPDHMHFHFASAAIKWNYLAESMNIPFSFSLRGTDVQVYPYIDNKYWEDLKTISKKATKVHAVCSNIKEEFIKLTGCEEKKVDVIRTVISEQWFEIERKPEKGLLISIGRLHWRKGFSDLILAAKKLKERDVKFTLKIIGDGPERPKLEYMINNLNLSMDIELLGSKDHAEIKKYFEKAELLVLSSLQEGFPNVLAEAMASEIPIVTTNCNGIGEVLNENNSYISEPGDPIKLSFNIELALTSDNSIKTLTNKKLATDIFSKQKHSHDFIDFYKTIRT